MTVQLRDDGVIALAGACPVEDAEALLALLLTHPGAVVDWRACERAHTAVVQVLMLSGAVFRGPPAGAFLRRDVEPALRRAGMEHGPTTRDAEPDGAKQR